MEPVKFTGEYFIPGRSPKRIEDDHLERYRFAARFAKGCRVLDIACGSGYGSHLLAEAGATQVDGVDISEDVIYFARAYYNAPSVNFFVGDVCAYSAQTPYDLIVSFETIEHISDYRAALSNLFRLLARGGTLLISTPNRLITSPYARSIEDAPGNKFHKHEFTIAEFLALLEETGFTVSRSEVYGQRQQIYLPNRLLRGAYNRIFRPNERTSPRLSPVRRLMPRYVLVVAHKA